MATVTVTKIDVSPNNCPISEKLDLTVTFKVDKPVQQGVWQLKYEVDYTFKRHILDVANAEAKDYAAGEHTVSLSVPSLDVSGVKRKTLLNMGLMRLVFLSGGEHISDVNMVVQVTEGPEDALLRNIMSPLE
eukprot:TRINITY_DN60081_c0_g1_i1.p1 TRINITY_DN60081_c0_g1~~TRINITY_DN60081_c0_g1_i1.p1  ORF type:complete len:132 (+),score=22.98 TRINITY_DN60081_c0_g1_i1:105-500(+)